MPDTFLKKNRIPKTIIFIAILGCALLSEIRFGFNEKDVDLLKYVLQNKQYKEIAQLTFRSEGTIRNRLNKIYDILQVGDRIGFLTMYTGYEITF